MLNEARLRQVGFKKNLMLVALTRGRVAVADKEDYEKIKDFSWYYHSTGYAFAYDKENKKKVRMHRILLDIKEKDKEVDHINGNKTDNRKSNLRVVTAQQNKMNRGKYASNKSGYKGVYKHKKNGNWVASIRLNKKNIHIGCFESGKEAALAYNQKAQELFGEYANLNKDVK